jgi:hypothetical protein
MHFDSRVFWIPFRHFATGFKVELMLNDEGEDKACVCDRFFTERLSMVILSIACQKTYIYSISPDGVTVPELFAIMEEG